MKRDYPLRKDRYVILCNTVHVFCVYFYKNSSKILLFSPFSLIFAVSNLIKTRDLYNHEKVILMVIVPASCHRLRPE